MALYTNTDKRKKIIIFSLIFLAAVGIASFLLSSLWEREEYKADAPAGNRKQRMTSAYSSIKLEDEKLSNNLAALLKLDQQYADALSKTNDKKSLDSISELIALEEKKFHGTIDKIVYNVSADSSELELNAMFSDVVSSYKNILQNRSSISTLRNAIGIGKNGLTPDAMEMLNVQSELSEKTIRISQLEAAIKNTTALKTGMEEPVDKNTDNNIALAKESLAEKEKQIVALMSTNTTLKQDNDRLLKEQNDVSKSTSAGELAFKNKTAGLQQKVDELNAELRLAQVDCNLSRVDAGQIISNSRQRKELLAEASGILTGLAKSDDPEIKKKVQFKIVKLNQIAANTRD